MTAEYLPSILGPLKPQLSDLCLCTDTKTHIKSYLLLGNKEPIIMCGLVKGFNENH